MQSTQPGKAAHPCGLLRFRRSRHDVPPQRSGGLPARFGRWLSVLAASALVSHAAWAAQWTDAMGRVVRVPSAPARIVSLVPSVTETLFAIGLSERIAGVTRFCNYPPEALTKPQVGGYSDPSVEAIAALDPDVVFAAAANTSPALLRRLESMGIPCYVVYPRSLDRAIATVEEVGRVAGAPEAAERLAGEIRRAVERVRAAVAGIRPIDALVCVMVDPLVVAGPETLADDLLDVAGGRNVVPAGPSRYPTWGIEAVLARDPEVIIVSVHPGAEAPAERFRSWPELRAVATDRVVVVEADWIHRPGPRLPLGLAAVARALHGDLEGLP